MFHYSQGTYVEGIKEEVVLSPGHALSFIAAGEGIYMKDKFCAKKNIYYMFSQFYYSKKNGWMVKIYKQWVCMYANFFYWYVIMQSIAMLGQTILICWVAEVTPFSHW